jgi:hypothetical protein
MNTKKEIEKLSREKISAFLLHSPESVSTCQGVSLFSTDKGLFFLNLNDFAYRLKYDFDLSYIEIGFLLQKIQEGHKLVKRSSPGKINSRQNGFFLGLVFRSGDGQIIHSI